DAVRADEGGGAIAEHQREQVEGADQRDGPNDRPPRLFRGRHGVEAHQHVRQARGAQHQRQRQQQHAQQRESAGNTRVVSRSGVDYADASVMYVDSDVGLARGRDVSGKVAEEGRGWLMRKREAVVGGAA
ncbi:hypothetical protein LTR39_005340, partial [Cryomyces antarcticus]